MERLGNPDGLEQVTIHASKVTALATAPIVALHSTLNVTPDQARSHTENNLKQGPLPADDNPPILSNSSLWTQNICLHGFPLQWFAARKLGYASRTVWPSR
jgi:hypothetical protein